MPPSTLSHSLLFLSKVSQTVKPVNEKVEVCYYAYHKHVSVVTDVLGADLTTSQDTPVTSKKENKCIVFNEEVHIQKSIDSLPNGKIVL